MPRRFVSVGDDLTLPDDVIVADGNLPARLSDGQLSATFAPFNKADIGTDGLASLGQSNTHYGTGVDTARLDRPQDRIKEFPVSGSYANTLVTAVEPLIHQDGAVGIGPTFRAAATLVKSLPGNRDVCILGLGYGSTGFTVSGDRTWDPNNTTAGTNLYNLAVAQIDKFLAQNPKNRLPWVVWQQGETDAVAAMPQATYATYLDQVIQKLRTRYGNDLIFAIVSMTPQRLDSLSSTYGPIDAAHVDVLRRWERTCFFYGPSGNTQDGGIHYTAAEQRTIGDQLAEYLLRYAPANVAGTPPVTPTGLSLAQSGQTVTATWKWEPGRVTGTLLEYRINGGSWQTVAGLSAQVGFRKIVLDTAFTLGTTVDARVSAINAQGTSAPSTVATLALATVPATPTGLTAGTSTVATQPLTWTAVAGATSYLVEYKATSSGTWLTGPTVTSPSATVSGLAYSTSYDFRVKAINAAGTSAASSTVTNSTQAPVLLSADVGTNPLWAWGTRKLVSGYSGALLRVRRSSDSTEQDIGQTAVGDLDTAALTTFVGANSAYVSKWYNQGTAGAAGDMAQATTTKQPRIVNVGTVDVKNGKPSAYFDGTKVLSHSTPAILAAGVGSILHVASTRQANTMVFSEATTSQTTSRWVPEFSNSSLFKSFTMGNEANGSSTITGSTVVADDDALHQGDTVDTGTVATIRTNGAVSATGAIAHTGTYTPTKVNMGAWLDTPTFGHVGYITEIAVWASALSSTARDNGAANQKAFYATP
ncbi:tail protein [Arthrobacter phage Eileen]|uniref:Fibronectin type-III domain-containing protein n=1 Tax=Arthrobacter phage Eileen TaxID=2419956 RepID=A0A3G2KFR8_9CAUD|nr:tail protein [Arthrobacter phage Eileen]AYN57818.1 hypothetical protein PBI_EILEEN_29 [Arthrobacter phage Eileen]